MLEWADDPVWGQDGRKWIDRRGKSRFPPVWTAGGGRKCWSDTKKYSHVTISYGASRSGEVPVRGWNITTS